MTIKEANNNPAAHSNALAVARYIRNNDWFELAIRDLCANIVTKLFDVDRPDRVLIAMYPGYVRISREWIEDNQHHNVALTIDSEGMFVPAPRGLLKIQPDNATVAIIDWRYDGISEHNYNDDYDECAGMPDPERPDHSTDYSPSAPWNAPGMKISDFI